MISFIPTLGALLLLLVENTTNLDEKAATLTHVCSDYSVSEVDDFGRGRLVKTKAIRVGDGLWVSTSSIGDEKKLTVNLVFSGASTRKIKPDEIHEFSLDNSGEKIIILMTPNEIKNPVFQTQSTGGIDYSPVQISTTTTYELVYNLTNENFEIFKTHLLNAIKIGSLSSDFPIQADRKSKLKLFRSTVACIG